MLGLVFFLMFHVLRSIFLLHTPTPWEEAEAMEGVMAAVALIGGASISAVSIGGALIGGVAGGALIGGASIGGRQAVC